MAAVVAMLDESHQALLVKTMTTHIPILGRLDDHVYGHRFFLVYVVLMEMIYETRLRSNTLA